MVLDLEILRATKLAQEFLAAHLTNEHLEVGIGYGKDVDAMTHALTRLATQRWHLPESVLRNSRRETSSVSLIEVKGEQSTLAVMNGFSKDIENFAICAAWCSDLLIKKLGLKLATRAGSVAHWVGEMSQDRTLEELNVEPMRVEDCEMYFFSNPNLLAIRTIERRFGITFPHNSPPGNADSLHEKIGPEEPNRFYYQGRYCKLEKKAWQVLDYLWNCPDGTSLVTEILEKVWGDDGTGKEKDGRMRGVQHSIHKLFKQNNFPIRIKKSNERFMIDKKF